MKYIDCFEILIVFLLINKKLRSNISIQIINLSFLDQYKIHILITFIYS